MRKLNPLIKLLPLAAAVLVSLPDVARAQILNYTNPVLLSISGPGLSTSQNIVVSATGSTITTVTIVGTSTNGINWLCANTLSNPLTITVSVGTGCGAGTAGLSPTGNTPYVGDVQFQVDGGTVRHMQVNLSVGATTGVGLTASPNPLTFNVAVGSGATSQNVTIFNSGALAILSSVTATTTTGQTWLQPFISGSAGIVTVNINPTILTAGSYTGTVFVVTTAGAVNFTVNLNVGTGGSGFGLAASPNPVSFNVAAGSGIQSQNVSITFNGSLTAVSSVTSTTNTGQSWLQVANTGNFGMVLVTVTPTLLFSGSDTGTVFVNTTQGQVTFLVTLTLGSGGGTAGLIANPSQLTVNVPFGSGNTSQNITITFNGSPVLVTGSSPSTANNIAWLQTINTGNTGVLTATVNASILNSGSYTGSIFVSTTAGTLTIPVSLTVES